MPLPSWIAFSAKSLALCAVVFAFLSCGVLACIAIQLLRGFTHIEPLLYLQGAFVIGWPFALFAIAALFLQVLTRRRADRRAALDARGGSTLHPLPEGLAGVLSAARRDRRRRLESGAAALLRPDKAFQQAPFTNTLELLEYIRREAPRDKQALIEELFARIVFYDNRLLAVHSERRPDGKYRVELSYSADKREADGVGREHPLPLDDWMEVGLFARKSGEPEAKERVLYSQRHRITSSQGKLELVTDEAPDEAGIDPYNELIDRIVDDNRKCFD
jgi:hypothetical protein